jgi:hypothetical protein
VAAVLYQGSAYQVCSTTTLTHLLVNEVLIAQGNALGKICAHPPITECILFFGGPSNGLFVRARGKPVVFCALLAGRFSPLPFPSFFFSSALIKKKLSTLHSHDMTI